MAVEEMEGGIVHSEQQADRHVSTAVKWDILGSNADFQKTSEKLQQVFQLGTSPKWSAEKLKVYKQLCTNLRNC